MLRGARIIVVSYARYRTLCFHETGLGVSLQNDDQSASLRITSVSHYAMFTYRNVLGEGMETRMGVLYEIPLVTIKDTAGTWWNIHNYTASVRFWRSNLGSVMYFICSKDLPDNFVFVVY